ncbi:MAG: hypothetical protein V4643_00135 [Bacteroidota bacterium]
MKTLYPLISLFLLLNLFSSCSRDCPKQDTQTNYVNQDYLPYIIPYSDTSTAFFLKNGKDTLLFRSQGLKETFENGSTLSGDCPKNYKSQQYSLKMAASDTDFFEIKYFADKDGLVPLVNIRTINFWTTNDLSYSTFKHFYPPIIKLKILDNYYDTVRVIKTNIVDSICLKPKFGYLKIKTANVIYEFIK